MFAPHGSASGTQSGSLTSGQSQYIQPSGAFASGQSATCCGVMYGIPQMYGRADELSRVPGHHPADHDAEN